MKLKIKNTFIFIKEILLPIFLFLFLLTFINTILIGIKYSFIKALIIGFILTILENVFTIIIVSLGIGSSERKFKRIKKKLKNIILKLKKENEHFNNVLFLIKSDVIDNEVELLYKFQNEENKDGNDRLLIYGLLSDYLYSEMSNLSKKEQEILSITYDYFNEM